MGASPLPEFEFEPTGLHSREGAPRARRCRCGRPRVQRRPDEDPRQIFYCPRCDEIPPLRRPNPEGPTT